MKLIIWSYSKYTWAMVPRILSDHKKQCSRVLLPPAAFMLAVFRFGGSNVLQTHVINCVNEVGGEMLCGTWLEKKEKRI